jgi:hypothetical protein
MIEIFINRLVGCKRDPEDDVEGDEGDGEERTRDAVDPERGHEATYLRGRNCA